MHRRTAELIIRENNSESDIIDIVGHPINAYNMIKEWYTPVTPVPPGMQGKSSMGLGLLYMHSNIHHIQCTQYYSYKTQTNMYSQHTLC